MYIHQVPRGTTFTFEFDENNSLDGMFDGNIDHMSFYIMCTEISRNLEAYEHLKPKVTFIVGENMYRFDARILGISEKNDAINDSLEFQIISPIKTEPLRKNYRIKIMLKVRIHKYTPDYKKRHADGLICEAISDDMSKNGMRLFTDHEIIEPLDTVFTLEFSLRPGIAYWIPAKLVRNAQNTTTRTYLYDIGFNFDFSEVHDTHEKILLDIIEHKIKNRV